MKRVKKNFNRVILGSIVEDLIYAIFALFLLFKTNLTIVLFIRTFGILLIVSAICSGIRFLYRKLARSLFNVSILNALLKLILGILIIIKPDLVSNIFTLSVGIVILVNGLIKLYYAFNFYNNKEEIWPLIGVLSVGLIVMGGALIINPFGANVIITRVIGVFILCFALFDTMQWLLFRKRTKELLRLFK